MTWTGRDGEVGPGWVVSVTGSRNGDYMMTGSKRGDKDTRNVSPGKDDAELPCQSVTGEQRTADVDLLY